GKGNNMPKSSMKAFYVMTLICTILIICYLWFVFLPQFEGKLEYPSVRMVVSYVILLLLAAACAQIYLLKRPSRPDIFE
ncbi:MAG: hypothetical protein QW782_06570, partial [Candidatus Bathyarchaeia archaeon]